MAEITKKIVKNQKINERGREGTLIWHPRVLLGSE